MSLLSLFGGGGERTCPSSPGCEHNKHEVVSVQLKVFIFGKQVYRDTEVTEEDCGRWGNRENRGEVMSEGITFVYLDVVLHSRKAGGLAAGGPWSSSSSICAPGTQETKMNTPTRPLTHGDYITARETKNK